MKTKQLGNSDLFITPVGYGSWAIGGSGWQFAWGKQNDDDSIAAIHRALELGVNWIDTAAVYGLGHSEEVVAQALAGWSGFQPYVFTKCGLRWDAQGQTHKVLTAASIRQECEDSLRRRRASRGSGWTRSTSTKFTGRSMTCWNLRKGGTRWRSCKVKARSAGSVFRISTWNG